MELPNRYVLVSPQTDKACQSGIPPQQKDITQNTFQLLHPPPEPLPHCHIAPHQNACQGLQFVPENPDSVPPVVVQESVANSNGTFQANLPPSQSYFLQRDRKEENLFDVQNTVPVLLSYTHETAQEHSSSKEDVAEVRPTFMDKNKFFAPSSSTAKPTIMENSYWISNDSQSTLDCTNNIQNETQTRYKKDNLIVVPTDCSVGVPQIIDCSVGEIVPTTMDCSIGVPPATDCCADEMVLPTTDYSVVEKVPPKTDYSFGVPQIIDCNVGEVAPPTTDCCVDEMVLPTTDCSIGVPPPNDCGFGKMVLPKIDCCVDEMVPVPHGSKGEQITVADTLCTSEGELGQKQNIEAGQHKHNSYSIMKSKNLINQGQSSVGENKNKELGSIKERETNTKEILNQSKCDIPKNQSLKGRKLVEMENEIVQRSAVAQIQIMDKTIERENTSKKEHRRVTRQSLKKAKMDIGQKTARGTMVMRSSRICKIVKEDAYHEKKKRVNAEEKQTQGKSKGQRKVELKNEVNSTFIKNTKRTPRSCNSLVLEEATGTQNVKMKTEKTNTRKDTDTNQLQIEGEKMFKVSESSTNPKTLTGRRNLGTSLVKDFEGVQTHTDQENPNVLVGKKEKDHRHKSIGRLTSQDLKTDFEVAQRIKAQINKVKRTSRSSKIVKVSDRFGENQERKINKEEQPTHRKSVRVSKQVPKNDAKSNTTFVMNTRTRGFTSHTSEDVVGTQNVKKTENSYTEMDGDTKQPQVEGKKNIKVAVIKSNSNSDILTGRTRKFGKEKVCVSSKDGGENVHISTRRYHATQDNSVAASEKQVGDRKVGTGTMTRSKIKKRSLLIKGPVKSSSSSVTTHLSSEKITQARGPVAEEAAEKCAKTKEGGLKSNTARRHDSAKARAKPLLLDVTTDKLKMMNEKESQGMKDPTHGQCKAKNCIGDKRTDERLTRSYTASLKLQVENNKKEMRESDGRNRTKNQKEETKTSGVKKGVRERQQKEARVDLKEKVTKEERNKDKRCRITRRTVAVTTQAETREHHRY